MKIVIDIPERDYDLACKYPNALIATYAHYIKDGTPYVERPQGKWILIAERLPDRLDEVLVTFQIPMPNREPVVYRAVFIGSKFALDNGDVWNWNDPEIKAWMPLPEAYKETENGNT